VPWDAIEHHRIGIFPASDPALIPANAGATYDGTPVDGGTIFIKVGKAWGRDLEGDLVHECTHAGFDLDKLNGQMEVVSKETIFDHKKNPGGSATARPAATGCH